MGETKGNVQRKEKSRLGKEDMRDGKNIEHVVTNTVVNINLKYMCQKCKKNNNYKHKYGQAVQSRLNRPTNYCQTSHGVC